MWLSGRADKSSTVVPGSFPGLFTACLSLLCLSPCPATGHKLPQNPMKIVDFKQFIK